MKVRAGIIFVVSTLLFIGCSAPKVLISHRANAEKAEVEGNYTAATEAWKLFLDQQLAAGTEIAPENYAQAAKSAYKANQLELAESWFEQARSAQYADPEMYQDLIQIFNSKNNLSKEMVALEYYHQNYPDQPDVKTVSVRLYDIYTQIGNEQKAVEIWPFMDEDNRKTEKHLDTYFGIQRKMGQDELADSLAEELLQVNPKHIKALEWLGDRYYQQAEERYQREMKAYEKNHTNLQHLQLVKELKTVTADFQKALDYFNVLWEINQNSRYATYMVNIYNRFENRDKANYYRKFLK